MEEVSKRVQKVQREVQRHLAEIIRSKGMAAFGGALITVSEVRMSPDLSYAKVYISCFPSEKRAAVMQTLQEKNKALRGDLGRVVAKQLRIVPELSFFEDTTLDYAQHIDDVLARDPVRPSKEDGTDACSDESKNIESEDGTDACE